jgi:hypothetical protein
MLLETLKKILKEQIFNKRKIPVPGLVMDYYSHIGADIPISP